MSPLLAVEKMKNTLPSSMYFLLITIERSTERQVDDKIGFRLKSCGNFPREYKIPPLKGTNSSAGVVSTAELGLNFFLF